MNKQTCPTKKIFKWFDSSRPQNTYYGPFYNDWQELVKPSTIHSEEDLMKLPLSDTTKKRIQSAKEGTTIKIHYLHSCGTLCVQRLTQQEIEHKETVAQLKDELEKVNEEIQKIIPKELKDKKNELTKRLAKLNKLDKQA